MKILKRVPAVILIVLILAAGAFWVSCRLINGRSLMAGVVDLVLTLQHRSDKFRDPEVCAAYLAEKAEANREPVVIEKAKFGISLREERLEPLRPPEPPVRTCGTSRACPRAYWARKRTLRSYRT